MAGKEIVQLYVKDVKSSVRRPEKELKGFEKVFLNPGEESLSNIAYLVISFAFIAYVYRTNSKIFKELLDTIKEFCRDRVAIICFIAFVLFSTWFNYDTFSLSNGSITMSGEHGAI